MISFILLNLIIYIPFHLFEEAVGDFPKWMYEHKWLPYHIVVLQIRCTSSMQIRCA